MLNNESKRNETKVHAHQLVGGLSLHSADDELDIAFDEKVKVCISGHCYLNEQQYDANALLNAYHHANDELAQLCKTLSGKFWVLISDSSIGTVSIFTDVMGLSPCYYHVSGNQLVVDRSLKSLKSCLTVKPTISNQAIFNYLYFHCIPSPNTIYDNVFKLEPGKILSLNEHSELNIKLFYQPTFAEKAEKQRIQELQESCLDVLNNSVKKVLSDDCGAFLSGGLDSSTVAGLLAKNVDDAKTFSIGFNEKEYDETAYAKITAEKFGTNHHIHCLTADQAIEEFVKVAQYFDEPFGNSSAMATYFCAKFAKENGVNTLLAGDGGDEIFAGNTRYAKQKLFEFYNLLPTPLQSLSSGLFYNTPLAKLPVLSKVSSYIAQAKEPMPARLEGYNYVNRIGVDSMFNPEFLTGVDVLQPIKQQASRYDDCTSSNIVDKMLYLDWKFTLADNDLVKVNNMCDMAGVDVYYPFLDKTVVDFSCQVPASVKLPGGKLRDFYKKSCEGFLDDRTLTKSKHGFGLPFGVWLKSDPRLIDLTRTTLASFKNRKIVSDNLIDETLKAHEQVHAGYYGELIWIMVVLELWLQENA
ncbi:asparagine synthetase B family protein [Flocculibacter collagenilyticus]|uniref:asparagine synthetase B family protein n=1 Tax=Flocculibacter collagenilyticus TaxID=2744479 RepID=UPI001F3614D2|nr:asparagine synthase-related protein [Flocculibacter collagenilyticus]